MMTRSIHRMVWPVLLMPEIDAQHDDSSMSLIPATGHSPLATRLLRRCVVTLLSASTLLSCLSEPITRQPGITTPFFDASLSSSFFDFPWPSDLRRDGAGHPIMDGFPNPENVELLDTYLQSMENDIVGFGNNAPVYFRLDNAIDESRLPLLPSDSLDTSSPVFLVNIDPDSPSRFRRTPIHCRFMLEATQYNPAHLLAIAPAWGFPLEGDTLYAAVILTNLPDQFGLPLLTAPDVQSLLGSGTATPKTLEPLTEPMRLLRDYLDTSNITPDNVAVATVFTTQDPVSDLAIIRDYLRRTQPEPQLDPSLPQPLWFVPETPRYEKVRDEEEFLYPSTVSQTTVSSSKSYWLFEGVYQGPNFQEGDPPYEDEGGAIRFDDNGDPILQRWEPLRFTLAVPKGEMPEDGWPIALYAHGTGGSYKSVLYSGSYTTADLLTPRGIATLSIDEPLHGDRAPEGTDPETMSFNYFNPDAARSNIRQATIDVFYLAWFAATALAVPADVAPDGKPIRFNPDRITFVGHSHGGLSGSMLAPFEPDIRAFVLSGTGGGLSLTILYRKDYVDFEALFRTLLVMPDSDTLDEFHSVMAIVQTLVEVTDPINYSPLYLLRPPAGRAQHILHTEGFFDTSTPPVTAEAQAVAGALPLLEPIGRALYGLDLQVVGTAPAPASLNVAGPDGTFVTTALAQFPDDNHFAISRDYLAAGLYAEFIRSASYDAAPVLVYPEP